MEYKDTEMSEVTKVQYMTKAYDLIKTVRDSFDMDNLETIHTLDAILNDINKTLKEG